MVSEMASETIAPATMNGSAVVMYTSARLQLEGLLGCASTVTSATSTSRLSIALSVPMRANSAARPAAWRLVTT